MAVAVGAFAAHGLESVLTDDRLDWIRTAARYQMVHALALLAAAWVAERWRRRTALVAGWAFVAGTLLFCGGLYLAGLADITRAMPVVPVGGLAFLLGWLALLATALRRPAA